MKKLSIPPKLPNLSVCIRTREKSGIFCFCRVSVRDKEEQRKFPALNSTKTENGDYFHIVLFGNHIGQTHLNFIENKGFINICNNLAIEKDGFSVVFKQKSLFVFSL